MKDFLALGILLGSFALTSLVLHGKKPAVAGNKGKIASDPMEFHRPQNITLRSLFNDNF